jgi:uncharacterized protein YcfJ
MKEMKRNCSRSDKPNSARVQVTRVGLTGPGLFAAAVFCIVALPAIARDRHVSYDYATVIDARPIYETHRVEQPRQECWTETVYSQPQRDNSVGTSVGAVVGGALGNAVGHSKKNKQVGAIVGALLGGTVGRSVSIHRKSHQSLPRAEQVCRTYNDFYEQERLVGFDVRYRYNAETYTTRTKRDPGDTIKLRLSVTPVT